MQPRFIRLKDAPAYLGMDRNRFNAEVRPTVTTIPIGEQGIAFDRLELDAWADHYVERNGRPGRLQGVRLWDRKERQGSSKEKASVTLKNKSVDNGFEKAAAQAISGKQKNI